jgi:hypothetical protein
VATLLLRVRVTIRAHRECSTVIMAYIAGACVTAIILFLVINRAEL